MEGATMSSPVNGVDCGVGPVVVFGEKVLSKVSRTEDAAIISRDGVSYCDGMMMEGGVDAWNRWGVAIARSGVLEDPGSFPVATAILLSRNR